MLDAEAAWSKDAMTMIYSFFQDENSVVGIDDEWIDVKEPARAVETQGSHHRLRHTIINLIPATDYEAAVQVKNTRQWGSLGKFNFSTRKG